MFDFSSQQGIIKFINKIKKIFNVLYSTLKEQHYERIY